MRTFWCARHIFDISHIRIYDFGPCRIEIRTHFLFPKSQLPPKTLIITNHHAILCPFPILPIAMPTTAHIRYYIISDHVESNIRISLWHQEPHQPQCQPLFISVFTNCNANHCPYSILHDFGPCRIKYMFFVVTPRASPTTMPSSAHFRFYQLQCQPLPIFDVYLRLAAEPTPPLHS